MQTTFNPDAIPPVASRPAVTIKDIIALTAELTRMLAEETDHLKAQRMRDVQAMHPRKVQLIHALEVMQRELQSRPELKSGFSKEDIEAYEVAAKIFSTVTIDYYRRLTLARAVNGEIIQTIVNAVGDQTGKASYSAQGKDQRSQPTISLRLNETF